MMMSPMLSQAGVQVAIAAAQTPMVARAACNLAGIAYPVYASYKALEEGTQGGTAGVQWLTYWTIYGSLLLVEDWVDDVLAWFPYYYHLKLAFLLYLALPRFKGAHQLYQQAWRPTLERYGPKVDYMLTWWHANLGYYVDPYFNALVGPVAAAVSALRDFVRWFFAGPGEPDSRPPCDAIGSEPHRD